MTALSEEQTDPFVVAETLSLCQLLYHLISYIIRIAASFLSYFLGDLLLYSKTILT